MGSLGDPPAPPPPPPPIIYEVPPPVAGPGETSEDSAEARRRNLLRRSRGRFGTIQTSFRGLLETTGLRSRRKTLLGE